MSDNSLKETTRGPLDVQPDDVRGLTELERNDLIVSATRVDGHWANFFRYGDDVWQLDGFPSNVPPGHRRLDFCAVPTAFRAAMKAMCYRYILRGRRGGSRPRGGTMRFFFHDALPFLRYLHALKLDHLGAATTLICTRYIKICKTHRQTYRSEGELLSQTALCARFRAVEAIYELSQYTDDRMPQHPWPETSARIIAGLGGSIQCVKTPLIPDDVFCTIFARALEQVERGQKLLDLQDALQNKAAPERMLPAYASSKRKRRHLHELGWPAGPRAFNKAMIDLRTACYVILASTSGCRNHELANLQSGAHHRTEDDEGTVYHWMRSVSEKTSVGIHDWMIPEVAVRALRLMERWSAPYQAMIAAEILQRRCASPHDPLTAEASEHRYALFLGGRFNGNGDQQVRTLSNSSWNQLLKAFATDCGLSWDFATHQFRRKFASYAAHSRFGDLRYLKEHFTHCSLDMTLGYSIDDRWGQNLDLDLYAEIQAELEDIKLDVVDSWLGGEPLAGGYGFALKHWQREPQNLLIFKDHSTMLKSIAESTSIRSNGHAWCTADDGGCVGNNLERTRCAANCSNSVIGCGHAPIYQRLYDDLKGLLQCQDIGEGGIQRIERDMNRCRNVLAQLGMDPEILIA